MPDDRVLEIGTALGLVTMTAAAIVGVRNVLTFDANPEIVLDAQANFSRNGMVEIKSEFGLLAASTAIGQMPKEVDFFISRDFWASRLCASLSAPDIVRSVKVPVFCLEAKIKEHGANVLILDIEGGEIALLAQADLSGIRLIIMETHYWSVGEQATDNMVNKLISDGFSIHLGRSGDGVIELRR